MKEDSNLSRHTQQTKSDGRSLEYSLTLLASFFYLFTLFYKYVNEQAVDYYVYDVVIFCLAVISVFVLTLLSYILVKILFFEAPDNVKTFFDQVASFLYNVASLFALMALLTCTYILWIYFGNNPFGLNVLMTGLVFTPFVMGYICV